MVDIKQRLDNDDHYVGGNTKEYIAIHDTGNGTDSDEGNANYFCTGARDASAHYFVDDDSITQVVQDNDCSWHVGDGANAYGINNRNSIGIEQCRVNGVVTAKTQANTLDLVVMLMKKYNVPEAKIVRHFDASRKNCPASFNLDGKWTRWYDFKNQLHARLNPIPSTNFRIDMFAHIQDIGNTNVSGLNDVTIGTIGKSLRVEALAINIEGVDIRYTCHVQDIGNIVGQAEGQIEGTMGQSKRLEAVKIDVVSIPAGYKLQYQAHVENIGWMAWVDAGQIAGTEGKSLRLEALRVRIVKA